MSLINVYDMAKAREYRKNMQKKMITKNKLPLISFTLNIPGPEKNSVLYQKIHKEGLTAISKTFASLIVEQVSRDENTGCEAYFTINLPAIEIKMKTIDIEKNHLLGRIFDIDVIDVNYQSVSRSSLNCPPRRCLICREIAVLCSRSRKHSIEELLVEIKSISLGL